MLSDKFLIDLLSEAFDQEFERQDFLGISQLPLERVPQKCGCRIDWLDTARHGAVHRIAQDRLAATYGAQPEAAPRDESLPV
jgi:hypothetical protein